MEPVIRKKSNFVSKKKYQVLLERVQRLESWKHREDTWWDNRFKDVDEQKRPKTTVLVFFPDGKQSAYHFHSEPDYDRIKSEMVEDGAFIVVAIGVNKGGDNCCYISNNHYFTFPQHKLKVQINAIRNTILSNSEQKGVCQ